MTTNSPYNTIKIYKKNEVYFEIDAELSIRHEIAEYFTFQVENYKFMPQYRAGRWDGKIRLYNLYKNELYCGLINHLLHFCEERNYKLDRETHCSKILPIDFNKYPLPENFKLRKYQKAGIVSAILSERATLLSATGCHKKDDKIMGCDGSWVNIQDISVGDYVIGPDGNPKQVIRTFTGKDDMYHIIPNQNREPITVNKSHILPLTFTNTHENKKYKPDTNISVEDYINQNKTYKHCAKLKYLSNEVKFTNQKNICNLSPYFIGIYLGDGSKHRCQVTTKDMEVVNCLYEESNRIGAKTVSKDNLHYFILGRKNNRNIIFAEFDKIGIHFGNSFRGSCSCQNRFIPKSLLTSSIDDRLNLLAGLLDSDGWLNETKTYFEITSKSKQMAEDIKYLAVSLGLICYIKPKYNKKYDRWYYRTIILGNISKIPTRIKRKQASSHQRQQNRYLCGFKIEPLGNDTYYGIQVEGGLYITESGMITHNSGKSLIQYMIIRHYQDILPKNKKLLIVVPTTSLVYQMYNDFDEYSSNDPNWNVEQNVHTITAGKEKLTNHQIQISTWQSLQKMPKNHFADNYGFINIDEAHLCKATTLKRIMESAVNTKYRFGTTGTLDNTETNKLVIQGLLGPTITVAKTTELMESGHLSELDIKAVVFKYPLSETKEMSRFKYKDEIDWITQHKKRINLCALLAQKQRKKVLFLFNYRKHGAEVYNAIISREKNNVFYIDGNTPTEERERIRNHCANLPKNSPYIIVASYQVYSTGINLPNIESIILGSPTKSVIRLLQSIGRGLRKTKNKNKCVVYDLVDDLRYKTYDNYVYKHYIERLKIYVKEKFNYQIHHIDMDKKKS